MCSQKAILTGIGQERSSSSNAFSDFDEMNRGDRQKNRSKLKTIQHCKFNEKKILSLINKMFLKTNRHKAKSEFGKGRSFEIFNKILRSKKLWKIGTQKQFQDIN